MKISKNKIDMIMASKGLTAVEVAKRSGISRQNFSTIKLRGTCTPPTVFKIANGLGVDPGEIIIMED